MTKPPSRIEGLWTIAESSGCSGVAPSSSSAHRALFGGGMRSLADGDFEPEGAQGLHVLLPRALLIEVQHRRPSLRVIRDPVNERVEPAGADGAWAAIRGEVDVRRSQATAPGHHAETAGVLVSRANRHAQHVAAADFEHLVLVQPALVDGE